MSPPVNHGQALLESLTLEAYSPEKDTVASSRLVTPPDPEFVDIFDFDSLQFIGRVRRSEVERFGNDS